jgi:hypothetical protein
MPQLRLPVSHHHPLVLTSAVGHQSRFEIGIGNIDVAAIFTKDGSRINSAPVRLLSRPHRPR